MRTTPLTGCAVADVVSSEASETVLPLVSVSAKSGAFWPTLGAAAEGGRCLPKENMVRQKKTREKKNKAEGENQETGPGHIAGHRIFREDGDVAQEGEQNYEEAEPEGCIGAALGTALRFDWTCSAAVGWQIFRHGSGLASRRQ